MHYMKRPRIPDEPRLLPLDYRAEADTVMIGRGRRCLHNEGNIRFRAMVKAELQAYSAGRKAKKSSIIKKILRHINDSCEGGVGFVKQDAMTGRYYTATVTAAKVTIAQAFRDALHTSYRSSKQHKQFKRDVARGKIDVTGAAQPNVARVCSTCQEEVNLFQGGSGTTMDVPSAPPAKVASGETSLQFWGDTIDPLMEFENAHAMEQETSGTVAHDCDCANNNPQEGYPVVQASTAKVTAPFDPTVAGGFRGSVAHVCGCSDHNQQAAPATKVMDPFEPIPLDMEGGADREMVPPHEKDGESSESSDSGHFLDTDDEDDNAMVVWATEFVHCPLCSYVQGRGDFEELPIHDIRKSLIG